MNVSFFHRQEAGEFVCATCTRRFKTDHSLYMHELRHTRRYKCTLCGACYRERAAAASHIMANHRKRALTCNICDHRFRRPAYLKKHMEQMHTKPNKIQCEYCPRVFYERSWYRSHVRSHNAEVRESANMRHGCDICNKSYKKATALTEHVKCHANNSCDVCKLQFKDVEEMKRHYVDVDHSKIVVRKPNNIKAVCPICERKCNTEGILKKHMKRMHASVRKKEFQCDYCKRFYYTKQEVRSHILWSHMRAAARWHECRCGRQFRTPARARQHEEKHHLHVIPERDHKCSLCGKGFYTKQILTRHMKSHTDETHKCPACPEAFKSPSYVQIHYKMKHLNMTRAQIREENQQRRLKELEDTKMIYGTSAPVTKKRKRNSLKQDLNDPLYIGNGDGEVGERSDLIVINDDEEAPLSAPRFDSFADVVRE